MALTQVDAGLLNSTAQYTGFKNRIINGAMQIWQRGTSIAVTSTQYFADRWRGNFQSYTASQNTDFPSSLGAGNSLDITNASGNFGSVLQRIEAANCRDLVGQNVTVSFWAKAVSGGGNGLGVSLAFATAPDNFSSVTGTVNVTLATTASSSWTQYTATFTNLPSTAANGIELQIYFNSTSLAYQYRYTNVQLEKGSTATSFDYRPYGTELALCQRYYWQQNYTQSVNRFGTGIGNGSTSIDGITVQLPTTMRTFPTATVSNIGVYDGTSTYTISSLGANYSTQSLLSCIAVVSSNVASGRLIQLYAINSSAVLTVTAEL